jgi:hypothetical protein
MLHTYKIDSRESGHEAESWSDAYALAFSVCIVPPVAARAALTTRRS